MEEKCCLEHKIILKVAEPNDLPVIFELVDRYSDFIDIDRNITKNALREIVYLKGALLVEYDTVIIGGIAGYVAPCLFEDSNIFTVMFFYVVDGYRFLTKSIVKEIELAMLPTKANKIVFGVPAQGDDYNNRLHRFFKMAGYKPLETHYYKRI